MGVCFELSGAKIDGLSEQVAKAVASQGYTPEDLGDLRTPQEYDSKKCSLSSQSVDLLTLYPEEAIKCERGLRRRLKRIIAKLFRWYVAPVANKQTGINLDLDEACTALRHYILTQQKEIELLKSKVERLEGGSHGV